MDKLCYEVKARNINWGKARQLLEDFVSQCDGDPYELAQMFDIDSKNMPLEKTADRCNIHD